jgi:putative inorganic carbon (HCO3(-)) transporter
LKEPRSPVLLARIRQVAHFLAQIEIWPVVLLVALSVALPRLLMAAVITAAFFFPVRWLAYGRLSVHTPADLPIVLIVVMALVSVWVTALPAITTLQVLRLLSGIGVFYSIANWCDSQARLRLLMRGAILAGLLLAIFATISVEWPVSKLSFVPEAVYSHFILIVQDTVQPNVIAGSLVILLPFAAAWLLFAWDDLEWYDRAFAGITVVVVLGIQIVTLSRGSLIALAVFLMVLLILRWRWAWVIPLLVGAGLGLAISRFGMSDVLNVLTSSGTISSAGGRLEVWSRAVAMIQDFPLTGIGMGSFLEASDKFYPLTLFEPGKIQHAHNLMLQVAVDLGIPGLIGWLAIYFIVLIAAWRVYHIGRDSEDDRAMAAGAALLGSQVALFVHGLTDAVTWGMVRPAPIVWVIWGMAIATGGLYLNSLDSSFRYSNRSPERLTPRDGE